MVTGALKMFFRELPEPLFPFRFFPLLVEAISKSEQTSPAAPAAPPSRCTCLSTEIKDSKCKLQTVKKLIQELPKPNQETVKVLFSHLLR